MLTWENLMLGKNASHVDMRVIHVDSHVNMGHLMSTWDFFPKAMLGKKCHVYMSCMIFTPIPTWDISCQHGEAFPDPCNGERV